MISLRGQLALLALVLSILPLGGVVWYLTDSMQEEARSAALDRIRSVADLKQDTLDRHQ